jgi:hypothetical protein
MPPPSVDARDALKRVCTCRKCGTNGKVLSRTKWYRHNPGGKKAKLPGLSNEEIASVMRLHTPPSPGTNLRKRHHDEVEVEAPISKRVAGSSLVREIRWSMRLEWTILTEVCT